VERGADAVLDVTRRADVDVVINAVVGAAGLRATLASLEAGKRLAIANKESLVAGGSLVLDALKRGGGELVPIDSEHSAILQCLRGAQASEVKRLILTASGGPFRTSDRAALETATPAQALRHPTWAMGAKITIDSATLANKALEVIEAHFLFGIGYDAIEVVVHPQSIVHSMVEFMDGSIVAQMGYPSMELPILYALTHPDRVADRGRSFDPVSAGPLTFEPLDPERFPTFALGVAAGRTGGTASAVFNAANEVAVAGFLAGRLPFPGIPAVIEATLAAHSPVPVDSLNTVLETDAWAREFAHSAIEVSC
jgi:1-deoxy-D-xylulose-5-phosphate reductoisomerase